MTRVCDDEQLRDAALFWSSVWWILLVVSGALAAFFAFMWRIAGRQR